MANNEATDDASISKMSGISLDPGGNKAPASAAKAAPPPMEIAPPKPDAVPASPGLTDNIPALADGRPMPLPRPMKIVRLKNTTGPDRPRAVIPAHNASPAVVTKAPISTIRFIPQRTENRPAMKLPTA